MIRRLALAAVLTTAAPCFADENPVPGALEKFGLLGTWAIDCAHPASPANEYAIYSVSSGGTATLAYARGEPYRDIVYEIRRASRVTEARMALRVLGLPGKFPVDLVLLQEGDSVRVWSSHTRDGRMLVIDGIITGDGQPSPRFKRCAQ